MEKNVKKAIEEYQCSGCITGCNTECFEPHSTGCGCGKHYAGTMMFPMVGKFFLGLPKGFNRLGKDNEMKPCIFEKFEDGWGYDKFNMPVWKHLNKDGHTIVRGLSPRINVPFLHIFLENCVEKIDCFLITDKDMEDMD